MAIPLQSSRDRQEGLNVTARADDQDRDGEGRHGPSRRVVVAKANGRCKIDVSFPCWIGLVRIERDPFLPGVSCSGCAHLQLLFRQPFRRFGRDCPSVTLRGHRACQRRSEVNPRFSNASFLGHREASGTWPAPLTSGRASDYADLPSHCPNWREGLALGDSCIPTVLRDDATAASRRCTGKLPDVGPINAGACAAGARRARCWRVSTAASPRGSRPWISSWERRSSRHFAERRPLRGGG